MASGAGQSKDGQLPGAKGEKEADPRGPEVISSRPPGRMRRQDSQAGSPRLQKLTAAQLTVSRSGRGQD